MLKDGKKDIKLTVSLEVTNTGSVAGSEAVQVYVSMSTTSPLTHVPLSLRAFKKARDIQPGEKRKVEIVLDKYAVSYWEERIKAWVIDQGEYGIHVGTSSIELPLKAEIILGREDVFEWNGL